MPYYTHLNSERYSGTPRAALAAGEVDTGRAPQGHLRAAGPSSAMRMRPVQGRFENMEAAMIAIETTETVDEASARAR
jgi:hypothetical protein